MNRNRLMKASAFLLVSTMATSCFVGSTFAKYVSEGKGEDSARVAKWGVKVVDLKRAMGKMITKVMLVEILLFPVLRKK